MRNKNWVRAQKWCLTTDNSKTIWRIKNCLRVLYAVFCAFFMMPVVFVIVEHEISHFFLVDNFMVDNHKSHVFLVSGKFFA